MPFFQSTAIPLKTVKSFTKAQCAICKFDKSCQSPRLAAVNPTKKLLIVGPAPSSEEDSESTYLRGPYADLLEQYLDRAGISLDNCSYTTAVVCKPSKTSSLFVPAVNIDYCRPTIIDHLEKHKPKYVILLGVAPIKSVITYLWKPLKNRMNELEPWLGWEIPSQKINAWVYPTFHPQFVSDMLQKKQNIFEKRLVSHLANVARRMKEKERPWEKPFAVTKETLKIVYDEDEAIEVCNSMIGERPVAFDYETNCRKPDNQNSWIRCIGMSNGLVHASFILTKKVEKVFKKFLKSDTPKIGHNTKFESRWAKRHFNVFPKNWIWDGMLNSHIANGKPYITSLKFQAFVRFGTPDYNSNISNMFESDDLGSYAINAIADIPETKLLTYCAFDAGLEWFEAADQAREVRSQKQSYFDCYDLIPERRGYGA